MQDITQELVDFQKKIGFTPHEITIFSPECDKKALEAEAKRIFSKTQSIVCTIDPRILHGLRIVADGVSYDTTVSRDLRKLREELMKVEITDKKDVMKRFEQKITDSKQLIDTITSTGVVAQVKDGIVQIVGMYHCMNQELLMINGKIKALAMNMEKKTIGAIILDSQAPVNAGDIVTRTGTVMAIPVSDSLLGRVINPLGEPLDGLSEIQSSETREIEKIAPGVLARKPVNKPLQTGITAIDALIPIGRGQRELILGDRQTGKTSIAIDTILNQKGENVICIYVAVGQKDAKMASLVETLRKQGAMDYTIIINTSAGDAPSLLYLAPYAGITIAEYFAEKGKDVLIVYDDLSKHAVAYRELSLLLRRPPGREAYPGDVFYLHSRLLERSANLAQEYGGGSITALPIVETQAGDISAYIPTNVISITDGQIFLESNLFHKEIRPAINVGLSVSRVGSSAQTKPMKKVAGSIKLALAQYRELEAFSQFSSDLDAKTKEQLERGKRITEVLKQKNFNPVPVEQQVVRIFAVSNGIFDSVPVEKLGSLLGIMTDTINRHDESLLAEIKSGMWDETITKRLTTALTEFSKYHIAPLLVTNKTHVTQH